MKLVHSSCWDVNHGRGFPVARLRFTIIHIITFCTISVTHASCDCMIPHAHTVVLN